MKGAIFDLDGTLIDSMWFWEKLVDDYLLSVGIEPPEDLRDVLKELSLLEGCFYMKDRFNMAKTPEEINAEIEELLESYYADKFLLKPYVLETLEDFKSRKIKMCLATATEDKLVSKVFNRLRIGEYFDFIQTSNNTGIGKKDTRFFQLAIDRLSLNPEDIWVFEDALHCIVAAKKTGLNVVAIADNSALKDFDEIKKYADICIDDFSQLDIDNL